MQKIVDIISAVSGIVTMIADISMKDITRILADWYIIIPLIQWLLSYGIYKFLICTYKFIDTKMDELLNARNTMHKITPYCFYIIAVTLEYLKIQFIFIVPISARIKILILFAAAFVSIGAIINLWYSLRKCNTFRDVLTASKCLPLLPVLVGLIYEIIITVLWGFKVT